MNYNFLKVLPISAAVVSCLIPNLAFADHDQKKSYESELPMVFNGAVCSVENKAMALLTSSEFLSEFTKNSELKKISLTTSFVNPQVELVDSDRLDQMISIIDQESVKTKFLMGALPGLAEMAPHLNKDMILKEAIMKKQSANAISAQLIRPVLVEAKVALSNLDCSPKETIEEETNELVSDLPKLNWKSTSVNEIASISPHP